MTRALHVLGTSSHAGKSVLTAAFGCWLRQQGLRVAPFKAQNMSLNSYVTLRGEEVARSQAAQAEVLGLEVTADMNPILLKPLDRGCQVVVQGRGVGVMSIHEYYAYKPVAWRAITASYDRLAGGFDAIVLDPPKLAPTAAHAERAARAYKDINRLALKLLGPGGVLFTFSCSGGTSADLYHKIVASAAADAGVAGFITERLAGAPDHPMTLEFPEGEYLKGLVVLRK